MQERKCEMYTLSNTYPVSNIGKEVSGTTSYQIQLSYTTIKQISGSGNSLPDIKRTRCALNIFIAVALQNLVKCFR